MAGKFVVTQDSKVAEKLINEGLQLIMTNNQVWYFVNSYKTLFNEEEKSKIAYTDILRF